jgi:Flp pilus assembly protein TadD
MEHARTYAALAVLGVLCGASIDRTAVFENEITMFADSVAKSPDKARPHNNLGDALRKTGRVEEAAAHFERAIAIKPNYPDALNNLATVYNHYGRRQDAIALLSSCLALEPGHLQARYNLAMTYYESGMLREAAMQYRLVAEIAPMSHEAAFARSMLAMIAREAPLR